MGFVNNMGLVKRVVKPSVERSEHVVQLSMVDQLMPRRHMVALLCFNLQNCPDPELALSQVRKGLALALAEAPDYAGVFQPVPGVPMRQQIFYGPESGVLFRELRDDTGVTYQELIDSHFHTDLLPDDKYLVSNEDLTSADGIRAMVVQANMIPGGLLLAMQLHHGITDAMGLELFLKCWAGHTNAQSQGLTIDTPSFSNEAFDRWRMSYGSNTSKAEEMLEFQEPPAFTRAEADAMRQRIPTTASIWYLSTDRLDALKEYISSQSPDSTSLTKSEAVCALMCCYTYTTRYATAEPADRPESVIVYVASDLRARMEPPLPPDYIGNASMGVPVPIGFDEVFLSPKKDAAVLLNSLANKIRHAINAFDSAAMRKRIGFYNRQPPANPKIPNLNYWPGPNILVTDSSNLSVYQMNWGAQLGQIDSLRSIGNRGSTGVCLVRAMDRSGGCEVVLHHETRVVDKLKETEAFSRFLKFVC